MPTGYIDKIRQNVILSKIPHENNLTINTHKQVLHTSMSLTPNFFCKDTLYFQRRKQALVYLSNSEIGEFEMNETCAELQQKSEGVMWVKVWPTRSSSCMVTVVIPRVPDGITLQQNTLYFETEKTR